MKTFIGVTVIFFFAITDAQAVFCDPSVVDPGDTGTLSASMDSTKNGQSSNRFGNDDCTDLPPIVVTGYIVPVADSFINSLVWSLGGLGIPVGGLVISEGTTGQTPNNFGCSNSAQSDRIDKAGVIYNADYAVAARTPRTLVKWLARNGTGKVYSVTWPDGSVGKYLSRGPGMSKPFLSEESCN